MNVRNQVIETAMINTKLRMGAKSINIGHKPVRTAANTPSTKVAK
jgi:hypothetical protein